MSKVNINIDTVSHCIDEMVADFDRIMNENKELKTIIVKVYDDLLSKENIETMDIFKLVTYLDEMIAKHNIDRSLL